jgi:hypothetical protein
LPKNAFDDTEVTTPTRRNGSGRVLPPALFHAFQKSTVFERVRKHREIVVEGNVFAMTKTKWIVAARPEEPGSDADLLDGLADTAWPGYGEPVYPKPLISEKTLLGLGRGEAPTIAVRSQFSI